MHLLIPFASALSEAAAHVIGDLALPHLARLLGRLALAARDDAEPVTLSPPHERALAAAWGWQGADGCLPFAARAAQGDGIDTGVDTGNEPWGLITPVHWHVGRDHVTLIDPSELNLSEAESRAAFDAVRGLFESEGFRIAWGAAMRWYVSHESLADLPCASLDRVIGRNVELWMRPGDTATDAARRMRRLQSELQLLLYQHPLNDEREARDALTLNSFWLSGCGRAQAERVDSIEEATRVDTALRAPLLADDWAAWADAWRALDAGPIAALLDADRAGRPVSLTLCGDRGAHRFESAARSVRQAIWQRLGLGAATLTPRAALAAL